MKKYVKMALLIMCGASLGIVYWLGPMDRMTFAQDQNQTKLKLSKLPKINSCVEHVKVVKAELVNEGDSQVAVLELENQAYIGVISISLETWGDQTKHSVVLSAFSPDKEPKIVIAPHETGTIRIGNLSANSPIRVGSVIFADGTEEGCESSKKTMRTFKDIDTKTPRPER